MYRRAGQRFADIGRFVRADADAVRDEKRQESVAESIFARSANERIGGILVGSSGAHFGDPGLESVVNRGVDLLLLLRGFATNRGARHVAEIAVPVGADVD